MFEQYNAAREWLSGDPTKCVPGGSLEFVSAKKNGRKSTYPPPAEVVCVPFLCKWAKGAKVSLPKAAGVGACDASIAQDAKHCKFMSRV